MGRRSACSAAAGHGLSLMLLTYPSSGPEVKCIQMATGARDLDIGGMSLRTGGAHTPNNKHENNGVSLS